MCVHRVLPVQCLRVMSGIKPKTCTQFTELSFSESWRCSLMGSVRDSSLLGPCLHPQADTASWVLVGMWSVICGGRCLF